MNSKTEPKKGRSPVQAKPRQLRAREATRRKLIDAALNVFAKKGLEATTILDITEGADVGIGTFYNHFQTKNELAMAVFAVRANELALANDSISEREKDAALVVAYILRIFFTKAVSDPIWGWFVVRANNSLPEIGHIFMVHARRDISRGIADGRFTSVREETAVTIMLATTLGVMRTILEGTSPPMIVEEAIECLLRMMGIESAEAKKLAAKKLPAYATKLLKDVFA